MCAGGARAPPEFGGSEKGRSLISAYRSLAITTNTPGFKKLYTALGRGQIRGKYADVLHGRPPANLSRSFMLALQYDLIDNREKLLHNSVLQLLNSNTVFPHIVAAATILF